MDGFLQYATELSLSRGLVWEGAKHSATSPETGLATKIQHAFNMVLSLEIPRGDGNQNAMLNINAAPYFLKWFFAHTF